jgi:hypothetical protein
MENLLDFEKKILNKSVEIYLNLIVEDNAISENERCSNLNELLQFICNEGYFEKLFKEMNDSSLTRIFLEICIEKLHVKIMMFPFVYNQIADFLKVVNYNLLQNAELV